MNTNSNENDQKKTFKKASKGKVNNQHPLIVALSVVDPILCLLTRNSGKPLLPLNTLLHALPMKEIPSEDNDGSTVPMKEMILQLGIREILDIRDRIEEYTLTDNSVKVNTSSNNPGEDELFVGFNIEASVPKKDLVKDEPIEKSLKTEKGTAKSKPTKRLGASTKTAARRRLAALKRSIKNIPQMLDVGKVMPSESNSSEKNIPPTISCESEFVVGASDPVSLITPEIKESGNLTSNREQYHPEELELYKILGLCNEGAMENHSAAYAGDIPARRLRTSFMDPRYRSCIPEVVGDLFNFQLFDLKNRKEQNEICAQSNRNSDHQIGRNRLFNHQVKAISAILDQKHTIICTSTGSGKSQCFSIPVMASIARDNSDKALLIYPTKALAQDQLSKFLNYADFINRLEDDDVVKAACLDGDTPHQHREYIAQDCNIVLTNPDSLHAFILPSAATNEVYGDFLSRIKYVVLDEAHIYEGSFGSHVSFVLSRLVRMCAVSQIKCVDMKRFRMPTFVACSATLSNPEVHFKNLVKSIPTNRIVVVSSDDDGSPCGAKKFFTWNPETVTCAKGLQSDVLNRQLDDEKRSSDEVLEENQNRIHFRRHAADETAILLAACMKRNIRCVCFCKTRNLVEWVYERCTKELRKTSDTSHLASKVESYRGGYSADIRRDIEKRLFQNKLLAVVGTNALELGVDIGGIDFTLHCGYPGSFNNLIQQSGRAGRSTSMERKSYAVMVRIYRALFVTL